MKHKDKLLHFAVSAVLVIAGLLLTKRFDLGEIGMAVSVIGTLLLGVAKEIFDYIRKKGTIPDYDLRDQCIKDFFADFFGVIAGGIIATILIVILW